MSRTLGTRSDGRQQQNRETVSPNTLRSRQWHPIPNPERCVTRKTDTICTMRGLVIRINPWTVPGIHSEERPPSIHMRSPSAPMRRPEGPRCNLPSPPRDSARLRGWPLHWARAKLECKNSQMYVYVCVCVRECVCEINVKENLGCNRHQVQAGSRMRCRLRAHSGRKRPEVRRT